MVKKRPVVMPECDYGALCTRKGCVYRHPKKNEAPLPDHSDPDLPICLHFLTGTCMWGQHCHQRHTSDVDELLALKEKLELIPCKWGLNCRSANCLYLHPEPVPEPEPEKPTVPGVLTIKTKPKAKRKMESIAYPGYFLKPVDPSIWTHEVSRDASCFKIQDPLDRYHEVNKGVSRIDVMDLHFQSSVTVEHVLDECLYEKLNALIQQPLPLEVIKSGTETQHYESLGVWVITGSGHHAPRDSHQAQGGVLFRTVFEYLEYYEYSFLLGQNLHSNSEHIGAFFVQCSSIRPKNSEKVG